MIAVKQGESQNVSNIAFKKRTSEILNNELINLMILEWILFFFGRDKPLKNQRGVISNLQM